MTTILKLSIGHRSAISRDMIADASNPLRLLTPLWSDQHIGIAWKLIVFNAGIRAESSTNWRL